MPLDLPMVSVSLSSNASALRKPISGTFASYRRVPIPPPFLFVPSKQLPENRIEVKPVTLAGSHTPNAITTTTTTRIPRSSRLRFLQLVSLELNLPSLLPMSYQWDLCNLKQTTPINEPPAVSQALVDFPTYAIVSSTVKPCSSITSVTNSNGLQRFPE